MARRSPHQSRVEMFLTAGGHELPRLPEEAPERIRLLQAKLLMEETLEAIEAMGVLLLVEEEDHHYSPEACDFDFKIKRKPVDLANLAKELSDVRVVATGTLSLFGIADEEVQEAVDHNNIAKIATAQKREDGKITKDPNHPKPDIAGILKRQTDTEV